MNLETMAGQLLVELESCGFSQPDRMAVWGCVVSLWEAEIERLNRIEAAARDAVDSGQAQYEAEEQYAGDLVPAAKMIALAEAVHGAKVVDEKPPTASDEYARGLEAALFEGAGDVGVSTPRDALSFARETVTAARAAANRGDPIHPTMTLKLVRLSEIGMGLAEAIRSGHCGPEAGSIRCLRAVVDGCAEHANDQDDDDGCPVGDPDCDLPADSLHGWCEAPDNEEALVEGEVTEVGRDDRERERERERGGQPWVASTAAIDKDGAKRRRDPSAMVDRVAVGARGPIRGPERSKARGVGGSRLSQPSLPKRHLHRRSGAFASGSGQVIAPGLMRTLVTPSGFELTSMASLHRIVPTILP